MITETPRRDQAINDDFSWTVNRPESIALLLDSKVRTWTSQEEIHLRLCRGIKRLGITPVFVYAERLPTEVEDRLRAGGAQIELANYHRGAYQYRRALGRIIDKYSVSMVHIHYFDYFSAVPWLARTQGVNTVVFEQLNGGLLKARAWRRRLIQLRATVATYPITRVIAISDFIKQLLVASGVDEAKISVRYLGVDTQRFSPNPAAREDLVRAYNIQPDEIVVSTIAFLRPIKDPDTIVKACGILEQRGVKVRMFVAGDGAMLGELKELAVKCGVAERTHWLGFCPDPTSLLQASDIFVLASIGEAFGFVLCEAMACGVPVVGSRIGAIPEVVEEGRTGFLATPQDPMAFAEAIERLAKDQRSRRRMGLNGIDRVRANFDVNLYVRNTLQIYESLSRT